MSSVQIFHRDENRNETLVSVIDGDRIKAHSGTIRVKILNSPPDIIYRFTLYGPSAAAFKHVIEEIKFVDSNKVLFIPIHHTGLAEAIDIHQAVSLLQIEPMQSHIEGHIRGFLSHNLVTPEQLQLLQITYGAAVEGTAGHKIMSVMVATLAYDDVHGHMSDDVKIALQRACAPYPKLTEAINHKVHVLRMIKMNKERTSKKRAAREAAAAE